MSAYLLLRTEFRDRAALRAALEAIGLPFEESRACSLQLRGYENDLRPERANFVIRKQHLNIASNDLGFAWDPKTRSFNTIVSEYDRGVPETTRVLRRLNQEYPIAYGIQRARAKGYRAERRVVGDDVQAVITGRMR